MESTFASDGGYVDEDMEQDVEMEQEDQDTHSETLAVECYEMKAREYNHLEAPLTRNGSDNVQVDR